jgi:hypothetical protein
MPREKVVRLDLTNLICQVVEWHPKLSNFEDNLHPNLSHPNRRSCLIFELGSTHRFSVLLNKVWDLEKMSVKRTTCAYELLWQVWFLRVDSAFDLMWSASVV